MICHICGSISFDSPFTAKEMMFGLRDSFIYAQCKTCGCLQIVDRPEDMNKYYPDGYYSHQDVSYESERPPFGSLRWWLWKNRNQAQIFKTGGFWGWLAAFRPRPDVERIAIDLQHLTSMSFLSRVLDVGCGSGQLLMRMYQTGFDNLTGIDPYLAETKIMSKPVKLVKTDLSGLDNETYDLIMLHHSLEHMPDQHQAMREIKRLLSPDGTCLIRVPTVTSNVWEKYREKWVELDAPRHFYIHSHQSLKMLASNYMLKIDRLWCDSDALAYAGSEMYQKNISLINPETGARRYFNECFSSDEIEKFITMAANDNLALRGGRIVAHLKHDCSINRNSERN